MRPVERIIELFAKKEKRERLRALAAKPSRWSDFRDALLHDRRSLEPSTMRPVTGEVLPLLSAYANARAYCISAIAELDDRETTVGEALQACVGRERDTLVFCLDSERAYYENHEGERFVLTG